MMNVNKGYSITRFFFSDSLKYYIDLPQHFLGEAAVTLPQVYRNCPLAEGDLEPILHVCLLDPSFPAFVEKVEEELKKLLEE